MISLVAFFSYLGFELMRAREALWCVALALKKRVRGYTYRRIPNWIRVGLISLTGFESSRLLALCRSPWASVYSTGPKASRHRVVVKSRFTLTSTPRWILRQGSRDLIRKTGFDSHRLCGTVVSRDFGRILPSPYTTYRIYTNL